MVEQRRQQRRVISLQAGPSEVDNVNLFDVNLRMNDRAIRTIGRQLTIIGDQMNREWAWRLTSHWPNMPRPAHVLTRSIYREIRGQLLEVHSWSSVMKAWLAASTPGQGSLRTETWTAWVSSIQSVNCVGWTRGILVTVALAAAAAICTAFGVA